MMEVRSSRILWIIPLLIVACILSFPAYGKYGGGTGEPNDSYQIATAEDLMLLGDSPEDYDKHFILTADIDMSGDTFTTALISPDAERINYGFQGTAFTGVFDGNGHKITGLTIDGRDARNDFLGLFGCNSGQIRNLGLEGSSVSGDDYVGGLVGINDGGDVSNCYSTDNVSGNSDVGGLIGCNRMGTVSNCYSAADVDGLGDVGGLVGDNTGIVWNCYSTGHVNGQSKIGGLLGYNSGGNVSNCYSTGDVNGRYNIGGLVGWHVGGSVSNCYSISDVNGTETDVGGLIGENQDLISNCFWATDTQTHGVIVSIGYDHGTVANVDGRTTDQMQTRSTFTSAGWDFIDESVNGTSETWQIPGAGGYPLLSFFHGDVPVPLAGSGTSAEPFLIGTPEELGMVSWYPKDCCFKLSSNIDLSGIHWSVPVVLVLGGCFDGDNHIITNMHISGGERLGLFGCLGEGSRVMNLGLGGGSVSGQGSYIGGLVGMNGYWNNPGGTIVNCYWSGIVSGEDYVGGLVGQNKGSNISDCRSIGDVSGDRYVGGLVGANGDYTNPEGAITNCYSGGNVSGNWEVGGLVGENIGVDVSSCYSTVDVKGTHQSVGGLIGDNWDSNVSNCYSRGDVSATEVVGGLIGSNNASTVANCYSTGRVSGDTQIGGLCGAHSVSGGIINCFWDKDTANSLYSAGGWAMTTAEMMTESTYVGWNNGSWVIDEGNDYPHLVWESTPGDVIDYEYPRTYPGNGQDQPFELDSPTDMVCMSLRPADWDKNFVLTGDIDMSSVTDYRPTALFTGSFGGQGHVLKNLRINTSILGNHYHLGVFGIIGLGGQVADLGVHDVNIIGGDFSRYIGGLCGENAHGTITACYTTGSVSSGADSDDLGGLCGDNDVGAIVKSHSSASVSAGDNSHDLGGLCGKNEGTITYCYATGAISGGQVHELGGLCGENDAGRIVGSHATGSVTAGAYADNLGGLVGDSWGGTIGACYSTGPVSGGENSQYLGGLVGFNYRTDISGCYSIGAVAANADSSYLSGLVGYNMLSTISNCYTKGSVSGGENSSFVGGLVGSNNDSTIRNCYSIGSVTGGAQVGGLCGKHSIAGAIVNSFWDKDTSGNLYSAGGWAMTTAQMMTESTYVGWNNGAWVLDEGKDYPHLLWENTPGEIIDYEYARTYPGNGQDQPFELDSPDDVLCMSLRPTDWDKNFVLTSDIDMSSVIYYQPPAPFTGSFDGKGHVLENLTIDASIIGNGYHLGVFGKIEDGRVANLGVQDVNVISGDYSRYVGGLCGENARGTIVCCFATGSVTGGIDSDDLGGLCGDNDEGTIIQSYSSASVWAGEGSHDLGGLCGKNQGTITDCYASGAVSGVGVRELGGLCGESDWPAVIRNCYSIGSVSDGADAGGFCGDREGGTVRGCFWDIETCGTLESDAGAGLTTAQMQASQTFLDAGWDFVDETENGREDIWCICEGVDYPKLTWQFIPGDFNEDYNVDLFDLAILSGRWSLADKGFLWCRGADLTNDGFVDFNDLEVFAENWLAGIAP